MKIITLLVTVFFANSLYSQSNPAITTWLQNNSTMGSHYVSGNSTVIQDNDLANVQKVEYSANSVYIHTNGIPAYPTGPFLDGNPSVATVQDAIFQIPLEPKANSGTPTNTNAGNIGIFINGVALFDYRDGVSYSLADNQDKGGPGGGRGDGVWNRDAVLAEMAGFDCSKGHPARGNYHHHQNPSAFKLDKTVVSTICNLYDADGLYSIDSNAHSPLIGFSYDGFPIYGAYGFANTDGTGGIARIKSSYKLRNITTRTHYADGSNVTDGPNVDNLFPLGHYREDYEFNASFGDLDEHNGRFCVTPEYPDGVYAYFCTVDEDWNSSYPYAVGPTFYGNVTGGKVNSISETTETYIPVSSINEASNVQLNFNIFPSPAQDFITIQALGLVKNDLKIELIDLKGTIVMTSSIKQGTTIWYLDTQTLYSGNYIVRIGNNNSTVKTQKIVIQK